MSETAQAVETAASVAAAPQTPAAIVAAGNQPIQSPPAAPIKIIVDDGPRLRLHQVAAALSRGMNRQLLAEYLQLRRAARQ